MDRLSQEERILNDRLDILKLYARAKLDEGDWHGIEDAGSDIRDVLAERRGLLRSLEILHGLR